MTTSSTAQAPPREQSSVDSATQKPANFTRRSVGAIAGIALILAIAAAFFVVNQRPSYAFNGGGVFARGNSSSP